MDSIVAHTEACFWHAARACRTLLRREAWSLATLLGKEHLVHLLQEVLPELLKLGWSCPLQQACNQDYRREFVFCISGLRHVLLLLQQRLCQVTVHGEVTCRDVCMQTSIVTASMEANIVLGQHCCLNRRLTGNKQQ